MRSNSGKGKSVNNRGNPTLEEHEHAGGTSGEAIHRGGTGNGSDSAPDVRGREADTPRHRTPGRANP